MKKVFMLFAVVALFASCAPKATEEAVIVEDSVLVIEEVAIDTTIVDTTVIAL